MNERIKQLAKQAGFYPEDNWDHTNWHAAGHNPLFEKFAELIIKECSLTAAMFSLNKNDIHPDVKWDNMTDSAKAVTPTTCQQVAAKIEEHFGM